MIEIGTATAQVWGGAGGGGNVAEGAVLLGTGAPGEPIRSDIAHRGAGSRFRGLCFWSAKNEFEAEIEVRRRWLTAA